MTVVQYEARFRALERIAPDLVPTKRRRAEHICKGLHNEIQMSYLDRKFATSNNIVTAVGEAE